MAGQPPCITITNDLTCFLITLTKCAIEAGWAGHVLGRRRCQRRPVCSFVDSPGASARARTTSAATVGHPLQVRLVSSLRGFLQTTSHLLALGQNHMHSPIKLKGEKTIKCIPKLRIIQSNGASAQLHKSIMNFTYTVNQLNL